VLSYAQKIHEGLEAQACLFHSRGLFWNIGELISDEDYIVYGQDQVDLVAFNIWKKVQSWDEDSYAVLEDNGEWIRLTESSNDPSVSIFDSESLRLLYTTDSSNQCLFDTSRTYSFELILHCKDEDGEITWNEESLDPCTITVEWENRHGCPIIRANALWTFFNKYDVYFAVTVIILGLFFLILGGYFIKTSVFIIVFWTVATFLTIIVYAFIISWDAEEWIGWIVIPLSIVIGAVVAFFTASFIRIGVILTGIWAGATVGSILFQTVVYLITSEVWMLWTLMAFFGLLGAVIAVKFYKLINIVGTSIIGAFLLVRGIAFYVGGYPNEFQLHNEIVHGGIDNVPWTVYVFVISMPILAILSILWKSKTLKLNHSTDKKDGYYDIGT
jgi:hypothetical protein